MAFDSNIVVYNPSSDPLVNFNFMLRVELAIDVPCKSVRAFQRELEFDQIQEGGLNDYVHMRRKPISRPFTLEVERYVGTDYFDPLPLGADLILPVLLFVSRAPAQFIPGVTARTYVFHGCTVIKKTYGDLSSEQAGILTETVTIAYREMLCVDVPWSKAGDNILAPDPAQAHSAKTQSTEPSQLKILGQELYKEASEKKTEADGLFKETEVTALIAELRTLETQVKAGVAESPAGLLVAAEADAKNTLDGVNSIENRPLFDVVNDLKADLLEKKKVFREAEKKLRELQDAARREQQSKERKQREVTEKLLNYKDQKKRAEAEIEKLKEKLNNKEQDIEGAKKAKDSAQAEYIQAQEKLREAKMASAEEKETLKEALQLAESKREALESALERSKANQQKETGEHTQAVAEAKQAAQQAEAAKKELETAEKALASAQDALEKAEKNKPDNEKNADSEENQNALKAAQENLEKAEKAKEEAQTAYDEAVKAQDKAKTAEESAKQQLDDAAKEIEEKEAELKAAQEAETEARNALESPATGSALEKSNAEVEAAQTKCDEAKATLDKAEQDAAILPRIAALEKSVEGFDARIEEMKADGAVDPDEKTENKSPAAPETESGEEDGEAPKTPLDEAAENAETAANAVKKAEENLAAAQNKATTAQKKLADAVENLKKGKANLHSLTNMINNLSLRETSVKEAREKYAASLSACETANTELQGYNAEDKAFHNSIRTKYQEVKKHHDDVIAQTKKVGEADEYRRNGVELKTQVTTWWTELQPKEPE